MKKLLTILVLSLVCAFCAVGFTACGVDFKINFIVDGEIYATVNTSGSETVKMPDNPTKDDYTFDGWFWDKDTWEKPFTANSLLDAPLSSDMSVYAKFKSNHNHEYVEQTTKEPTCTEKGEKTFTCECGDSYTEEINALGHVFTNYVSDNNATYESDGTKTAVCDRGCGATDTVTDTGSKLPEITEYFEKKQDGSYYGKVYNTTTTFDFTDKIEYDGEYFVCTDQACTKPLADNKTSLTLGDNLFYILYDNGQKSTATVRRRLIYTVTFNTVGGTAVSSQNIEEDKKATVPSKNPMRIGYTFSAWDYDFNEPITDNITIAAIWNANMNTQYKIEYYLQNLENDNYTLQENDTEYLTGTTDTTATATKVYEHFTIKSNTASGNINADGSTVLKVYYTRDKYTFSVANENTKGGTINCTKNGTYKYGTTINLSATLNAGYDFLGWYSGEKEISKELQYVFNLSEIGNISAKYFVHIDTPYKVEYYLQNLENDNYTLDCTENLTGTTDTTSNAQIKIYEHFTYNKNNSIINGNINGDGSTVLKVYYTRDKYTFSVANENTKGGIINCTENGTYKYGTTINLSATLNAGYDFLGWFNSDIKISDELQYNFNLSEINNMTAKYFAHTNTCYKLECYLQNLEDDNYTLKEDDTETLTGTTDTTANAQIKTYEHFTYNKSNSIISGNINGDSSTVLKIYYTRDKYTINITADEGVTLSKTYADSFKYGTHIDSITATFNSNGCLGFEWKGWYSDGVFMADYDTLPAFTVDKPINYIVKSVKDEMLNFNFTATATTCIITGLKNKTVKKIVIPDFVTSIGSSAFHGCSSLISITIPNGVTSIGYGAFSDCSGLTSITIPDSVTSIENYTFSDCSRLTRITIPDSVTSIGEGAFSGCSRLTSITIPDSVTSIGSSAFYGCSSLQYNKYDNGYYLGNENNPYLVLVEAKTTSIMSCTIHNDTKFILDVSFAYCSNLTSVTIPDSVMNIGYCAFYGCSGLTSINVSENNLNYKSIESNLYSKDGKTLIQYATGKTAMTFVISDSVTSIENYAFLGCSSLTSITIPDSVTSIGWFAFCDCGSLTSVYYKGKAEDWTNISIGSYNYNLTSATRYYYSETVPTDTMGNYWHYDTDGITPVIWVKED